MKPPSPIMIRVLRDILAGRGTHHGCHGMSEHGGRSRIIHALYSRGLIKMGQKNYWEITKNGEEALAPLRTKNNLVPSPEARAAVLEEMGRSGGNKAAANMTADERSERARKAVVARWKKYRKAKAAMG